MSVLFFYYSAVPQALPSFPTRRSSDLAQLVARLSKTRRAIKTALLDQRLVEQSRLDGAARSEEHTSELQSHVNLVCRLLLEKKNHVLFVLFAGLTDALLANVG